MSGRATQGRRTRGAGRRARSPARARDPLGEAVRLLFSDLRHAGEVQSARAAERVLGGEAGRTEHGTRVRFSLRVAAGRVREARYRAYGCPYTLACCEWLAGRLEGARLPIQTLGEPARWALALSIPPERLGRLLVIEDALRAALGAEALPPEPTA